MLQDYRRQTAIKPFAPKFKDRSSKQWDSEIPLSTNLSLLSISNSSKTSDEDGHEIINYLQSEDENLSSSRASSISPRPPPPEDPEEHKENHLEPDPYIFTKHLNGIPSTNSNLNETDVDPSLNDLFDENKSSSQWKFDDYDPRSIRPPPFSEHIKQIRDAQIKPKSNSRRSARISVRTNKSEQLKLARQQSASEQSPKKSLVNSSTTTSQHRLHSKSPVRRATRTSFRMHNASNWDQLSSNRTCKDAFDVSAPLVLSSMLVKQMREDIKSNRVPAYSKPLSSALLREQPHPPFNSQYRMKRVRHWLKQLVPTDYIEYNEYASNETTIGTNFNDKLDDECELLSDEKRGEEHERTYEEAHHHLPLFKSEIQRKMQHHNLLLARLELDLYVI